MEKQPSSAFCPGCGGPLVLVWKRGKCVEGTCTTSGGKLAKPTLFVLAVGSRRKTNGLLSGSRDYWCGGCGKKLKSRASKSMRGMFDITTNCACGRGWNGHDLGDDVTAMGRAHRTPVPVTAAAMPRRAVSRKPEDLLALAKAGAVATLELLADRDPVLAYRWLCVAADFGSESAERATSDLLSMKSSKLSTARMSVIHRRLADDYTTGRDLPRAAGKAKKHRTIVARLSEPFEDDDQSEE